MAIGLVGRKVGMTRIFTEDGVSIPVTVLEASSMSISQIKTADVDGYTAIQVTAGKKKKLSHVSKPLAGHFAKAAVSACDVICEFRADQVDEYSLGQVLSINDIFSAGQFVDVTSISKGKGFAGTVKRHNFRTQDATHGNSRSHRVPGSTGQNQTPGRVFKGKKMAGHMGNRRCTTQNLELVRVDSERNLLLIKGAVPGAPGSKVKVNPAVKKGSESK